MAGGYSLDHPVGCADLIQNDQQPDSLPLTGHKAEAPSIERSAVVGIADDV